MYVLLLVISVGVLLIWRVTILLLIAIFIGSSPANGIIYGCSLVVLGIGLLPLIPNLLVALTLKPMLGKRRGYLMLYMPDYSWIAMVCGSFSLVWSFLSTRLVLRALRKS